MPTKYQVAARAAALVAEKSVSRYLTSFEKVTHRIDSYSEMAEVKRELDHGSDRRRLGVDAVAAFRLIDGAGNDLRVFRLAVGALGELSQSLSPVLVHCHAGRSRSVAVVAGYFASGLGMDPEEAMALVAGKRSVSVAPALAELLLRL